MKPRLLFLLLFFPAFCVVASAQHNGTAQPSARGVGPVLSSNVGKYSNWDTLANQGRSGDYLLGSVTVSGSALPWDAIPITVTCDGRTRYTTDTDPKGHFVIASIHSAGYTLGAPDPNAKLVTQFVGCDVQAVLAGFDSTVLRILNRNLLEDPDIGTINLNREEGSGSAAVSNTSLAAPKDSTKAFEKARIEWMDQKPDWAQHDLEKAVKDDPQFAEAWYQLGKIQEKTNPQEATRSFSKAVAADQKFILPYQHLAS